MMPLHAKAWSSAFVSSDGDDIFQGFSGFEYKSELLNELYGEFCGPEEAIDDTSRCEPLDLDKQQLRLLTFNTASYANGNTDCVLHEFYAATAPEYAALSNTWGYSFLEPSIDDELSANTWLDVPCDTEKEGYMSAWSLGGVCTSLVAPVSFCVGAAAALDVGDYLNPIITSPWSTYHECPTFSPDNRVSCTRHMIVSTLAFSAATTTLRLHRRDDRYQDHFLLAGMTLGICGGLWRHKNLEGTIFKVLPWAVLGALLCSMIFHVAMAKVGRSGKKGAIHLEERDCEKCVMDEEKMAT